MFKTFAPLVSLLFGVALLLSGSALLATVLPLRGLTEGFSPLALGLMGSTYYAGFVVGCLTAPHLILRAGHIRAYATLVALAAATALIHPMIVGEVVWTLARAITGFCLAGFYIIIESWLNDRATNDNRGLIMSVYIAVNFAAVTAGQLMVTQAPVTSFVLFTSASILTSLAVVPVALTTSAQPAPVAIVQFRPLRLFRIAPVGLMGSLLVGVANGAFWSLATVYAVGRGLDHGGAAVFLSVGVVGGALLQWPIGRISDRFDRRAVLAVITVASAAASLALAFLPLGITGLMAVVFVFGAVTLTGYSIAAAHAYDRAERTDYVEMATGVLLANGVGSIIGPILASAAMQRWGDGFLFVHIAAFDLLLTAFIALRARTRPAVDPAAKETFDVYSTAPVGVAITPQPLEPDDPNLKTPGGYAAPIRPEEAEAANETD